MIISFKNDGAYYRSIGYRNDYTKEMIDALSPIEGYGNYLIYDEETINRVWMALDTGGTVSLELDSNEEVIKVVTENGDLDPPTDEPTSPQPKPTIELIQVENAELWHDSMMKDVAINFTIEETAELWHKNMMLDAKLNDETSNIWYEIMTGGIE